MESVTTAVTNLLGVGTQILDFITKNQLLMLCFSGCLVGVACTVVRRVKKTAIK